MTAVHILVLPHFHFHANNQTITPEINLKLSLVY